MNRRLAYRTRRLALPLLAALWLCAQALGLAHRTLHLPLPEAVVASASTSAHAPDDAFGHDEGGLDCRLYDQLAHADLAFGTAADAATAPICASLAVAVPGGRSVAPPAAFLARGPPIRA